MNYLTFDTETMDTEEKLMFDIGFAVHNENGKIIHKDHFLVEEVFDNSDIMDKAFYKCNIPIYLEMLETGKITKQPFHRVIEILKDVVSTYNVETVCAYNLLFDLQSFHDTIKYAFFGTRKPRDESGKVIKSNNNNNNPDSPNFFEFCKTFSNRDIFGKELKYMCLYGMTVTKLLTQDDYIHLAVDKNWKTEKGNLLTGAECAYRFISGDYDFAEKHTALSDVMIEVALFSKCQEIEGEYDTEIIYTPFRLVKKRHEELYGKPA